MSTGIKWTAPQLWPTRLCPGSLYVTRPEEGFRTGIVYIANALPKSDAIAQLNLISKVGGWMDWWMVG